MFSSRYLQHGFQVEPQRTADADAWDDSVLSPHGNCPHMHIEVLGDDFRPYKGRGLGDSRRVRALLRLLGIRDFCSHESVFSVNWWGVVHPSLFRHFSHLS